MVKTTIKRIIRKNRMLFSGSSILRKHGLAQRRRSWGGGRVPLIFGFGGRISNYPPNFSYLDGILYYINLN